MRCRRWEVHLTLNKSAFRCILVSKLELALDTGVPWAKALLTISGHTRLSRDSGSHHDNVGSLQSFCQASIVWQVSGHFRLSVDMIEVSCNTGNVDNVVE